MLVNVPISLISHLKIKVIMRHLVPFVIPHKHLEQPLLNDTQHLTAPASRCPIKLGLTFISLHSLRWEWHVHTYLINNVNRASLCGWRWFVIYRVPLSHAFVGAQWFSHRAQKQGWGALRLDQSFSEASVLHTSFSVCLTCFSNTSKSQTGSASACTLHKLKGIPWIE